MFEGGASWYPSERSLLVMLPAEPDAAPALNTTTRTSPRALGLSALAVVAGWDDSGAGADVGAVAWLVAAGVSPFPAGPLSITWRSTMPRTTARPTSPAPRTAELTPEPPRPPIPLPVGTVMLTANPGPRGDLQCGHAAAGYALAARA